jgi:hypothetical protein
MDGKMTGTTRIFAGRRERRKFYLPRMWTRRRTRKRIDIQNFDCKSF